MLLNLHYTPIKVTMTAKRLHHSILLQHPGTAELPTRLVLLDERCIADLFWVRFSITHPQSKNTRFYTKAININADYINTHNCFVGQLYVVLLKSLTSGSVKFLIEQPALQGEAYPLSTHQYTGSYWDVLQLHWAIHDSELIPDVRNNTIKYVIIIIIAHIIYAIQYINSLPSKLFLLVQHEANCTWLPTYYHLLSRAIELTNTTQKRCVWLPSSKNNQNNNS